jgi:hypothetical protein
MKRISPHLIRGPEEEKNISIEVFYDKILNILRRPLLRVGAWQLLECSAVWEKNQTNDNYISFAWQGSEEEKMIVAVNFSGVRSQCYLRLPFNGMEEGTWILHDLLTDITYEREGADLQVIGLYLDEPEWKVYVFTLEKKKDSL